MKRHLFSILFLSLLGQGWAPAQQLPPLVAQQGYADIILINGKIVSMDDRSTVPDTPGHIYEAMAIKGKRIQALGTNAEIRGLAGPETRQVELGQKTVIPGLIATHYHTDVFAAINYGPQFGLVDPSVKLRVVAEKTAEATAKKLRDTILNAIQVQKVPEGQWITVYLEQRDNRASLSWLYLGQINRRQIDKGTEKYPVLIKTGIQGIFNTAAIAEFTKVFPDWAESTELENRPGASENGYAAVPEQQAITYEVWWKDQPLEKFSEILRLQGLDIQKLGITTVSTRLLHRRVIAAFNRLNQEGAMPHRLAYYIEPQRGNVLGLKSIREFYRANPPTWTSHAAGGEMFWMAGMSHEIWDAGFNEVCLGPDMPAPPEIKIRERCPSPGTKSWESLKVAILNGWRPVGVHSEASHGARLYIQMLDEVMEEGGYSLEYIRSLRPTLEHLQLLGNVPDIMEGIKKYGILLNPTPSYLGQLPETVRDYGEGLVRFAMPVKSWIDQGIRVTFEADFTDFWTPIYTLVTRKIPVRAQGNVDSVTITFPTEETFEMLPEEAIDRVTALKMTTTWASEYMLAEDTLGTLEPGKYADFAVLDKDFFTVPIEEIRKLKVVMTGLAGKIVYDQDRLASDN